MNIAFFHSGFSNSGGIERAVSIILNHLSNRDDYNILSIEFLDEGHQCVEIDGKVKRVHLYESPVSMKKAIIAGGIIQKVKRLLKKYNVDIVIGCGALYFPVAVITAKLAGAKSICWEHTNPKVCGDYKFQKQIRRFGLKHSDANVLITEAAKKYYDSLIKKENLLIYNPVDDRLFEEHTSYDINSKKIISVGRLCYAKNYDLLIKIAEKVLENHLDWKWDIYGDGEDFDRLQHLIFNTSVADRLTLKGNALNIYELYPQYSFIVMTSRYEGFPMVLLEAAAKSLPLVSFDIETGPNEIISNGINGYLIDATTPEVMTEKIDTLMCDADRRISMSKNSYDTALKFSVERICEQWVKLLTAMKK